MEQQVNVTSVEHGTWSVPRFDRDSARRDFLIVVAGILLGGVGFWMIDREVLGLFHDDGIYAVIAKSISEGNGYRIASLPNSAFQTKYPFVYSYLLSWIWTFRPAFPENIFLLKAVNVVIIVALFYLSYLFFVRNSGRAGLEGMCYAMLVCTNRVVLSFINVTVSDLLFLLFVLLALTSYEDREFPYSKFGNPTVVAALTALACLTRPAGVPLIVAGAVHFCWRRRYRDLLRYFSMVAILITPWFLWQSIHASDSNNSLFDYYLSHSYQNAAFISIWSNPIQAIDLIWANLQYLVESLDLMLMLAIIPGLNMIVYALIGLGLCVSLHKHTPAFWCFVFLYTCLLLSWPFHPVRYVVPLIPVLMLFLFRGARRIEQLVREWAKMGEYGFGIAQSAWLPVVVILIVTSTWVANSLLLSDARIIRGAYGQPMPYGWKGFTETFAWVRNHTEPSAVLATAYDPMYYLYTGRKAIRPALHKPETYFYPYGKAIPKVGSAGEIQAQLSSLGVDYLIVDPLDGYAEKDAELQLFEQLIRSITNAKLVFTSSDARHQVYALRNGRISQHD